MDTPENRFSGRVRKNTPKLMILEGILLKSPAQGLKAKAQVSLSPKLSSRLSHKAQVRLSSVGH